MGRGLLLAVSATIALLAYSAGAAGADSQTLSLGERIDPTVGLASVTYPAALPGLGEVLAQPLAVTDADLASVGAVDSVTPLSLGPATFVVDDDLQQCPDADFTTPTGIQQAITAAPPGATIKVCAGTYTPINVNKTLTIYHDVQHGQATQCAAAVTPDPTKDAVIDGGNTPAIAVTLAANNIVFYGFTVQNTNGNPGIYTLPAFSGYELLFNVVQLNTFGLYLHSNGVVQTEVSHNCFRLNNRPGSSSGDGIYSDQGLHNAVVDENFFTQQDVAAAVFVVNQSDLTVTHNDDIDGNTIVLADTQGAYVAYNHLVNTGGSGIFIGGGVTQADIAYNLIENPGGSGITVNNQISGAPNTVVVERNHVRGSPFDGIRFDGTSNSTIANNKSERNLRDGIRLRDGSNGNSVHDNLSRDNARDGLRVDAAPFVQSNANSIEKNKMLGNGEHDCHDDTVGTGTGGTANLWIKDIGKTENRPGLCKNAS